MAASIPATCSGWMLIATGLGTLAAEGRQVVQVEGRGWLVAPAPRAEVALVAPRSADQAGNLV